MLQPQKATPTSVVAPSAQQEAAAAPSAARANGRTRPARASQFSLPFLSSISPFKSVGHRSSSDNQSSSPWQPPSSTVPPDRGLSLSDPPAISERDNCDRAAVTGYFDQARVLQAPPNSSGHHPLDSIAAPTAAAAPSASSSLPVASTSPAFRGWDERVNDESLYSSQLAPPAPISKSQPTWDSSTGSPLVDEEGFDLDLPFNNNVVAQQQQRPLPDRIIGSK
ncbi:hypothetical protein PG987_005857 [Apiospora arundinis]